MAEQIIISNAVLIKALFGSLTALVGVLVWQFKLMNSRLEKINDNLMEVMTMFAPREETNESIIHLGICVQDHGERIKVMEDWRKTIDCHHNLKY